MAAINHQFWKFKRVAVVSSKGGVGKTTNGLHIAYQLKNKHQLKYQFVDADPQESGTKHCLGRLHLVNDCKEANDPTKDLEIEYVRVRPIPDGVKRMVKRNFIGKDLYVIPNTIRKSAFKSHFVDNQNSYDGFIIDTQGSDSRVGRESMTASDIVIIPVNPSGLVVTELAKLMEVVVDARQFNPDFKVFIVFSRVVSSAKKIAREHIKIVNEMLDEYFMVNHSVSKAEANIFVCETVITERQEIYNNLDIGLNAFEMSKGKTLDCEIQFDTLLDEIEYLYDLNNSAMEVA
ncbi:ParA family protein [Pseudomonas parafulva]|uniref:ParA family protein n=1 Tax=Pseudomonas parafulva TaxID=157782 RepID=UPI003564F92E